MAPDWTNFRLLGDGLKITAVVKHIFDYFFHGTSRVSIKTKNWVGRHFGRLFSHTHLVTLFQSPEGQIIIEMASNAFDRFRILINNFPIQFIFHQAQLRLL
jgi:hypothetical protein